MLSLLAILCLSIATVDCDVKALIKDMAQSFVSGSKEDIPSARPARENVSLMFRAGSEYFHQEKWNDSYSSFMASWQAFNETKQYSNQPEPEDENGQVIREIDIIDYAQYTAFKSGLVEDAIKLCKFALDVLLADDFGEERKTFVHLLDYYKSQMPSIEIAEAENLLKSNSFYEYCDVDKTREKLKKLATKPCSICRLSTRGRNPFFLISPIKEEIINWEPFVVLFHDIVTPSEIEVIKYLSANKFKDSNVISLDGKDDPKIQFMQDGYRKAKTAWIYDGWGLRKLTKRMEAYTGLDANSFDGAEHYQVTHYGIGGHNAPHYDVILGAGSVTTGDRIATLLLYLTDVELGGGTLFNKLNLTVSPVARAGLFWHNVHQNETYDARTLHSACPVLRGQKAVTNRWFRARGQYRTRPCALEPDRPYTERSLLMP